MGDTCTCSKHVFLTPSLFAFVIEPALVSLFTKARTFLMFIRDLLCLSLFICPALFTLSDSRRELPLINKRIIFRKAKTSSCLQVVEYCRVDSQVDHDTPQMPTLYSFVGSCFPCCDCQDSTHNVVSRLGAN